MYSARFCKSSLTDARRAIGKGKSALKTALTKADRGFLEARRAVTKLAPRRGSAPTEPPTEDLTQQTSLLDTEPAEAAFPLPEPLLARDGTVFLHELPKELLRLLFSLQAPLQDWLEANPEADAHAQLLELYFALQDITRAAERYDAHFVTQLTARGSELEWELLCLDPAPFVDASLAAGRAAALFSATLTPPGYYRSRAGLSRCPGCGTGKPVSARTSGALLPARHLHPLPGPGGQCAGRLGCTGRHWPGPRWATIWPFFPATPICGRYMRTSPLVTRTSGRWPRRVVWTTRPGGLSGTVRPKPRKNAAGLRSHGRHLRRGCGSGG